MTRVAKVIFGGSTTTTGRADGPCRRRRKCRALASGSPQSLRRPCGRSTWTWSLACCHPCSLLRPNSRRAGVAVATNGDAEAAAACGAAYDDPFTSANPPVKQRGTLLDVSPLHASHVAAGLVHRHGRDSCWQRVGPALCSRNASRARGSDASGAVLPRLGPSNSLEGTLPHPELPLPPQFPWPQQGHALPGGPISLPRQEETGPWGTGPGFRPRSGRLQLPGWPYIGEPVFAAIANPRRVLMMDNGTWYILVYSAFPENDECRTTNA
ncbi:uncharacterized protein LOC144110388 [Amblyomma americanum]